MNSAYAPAKGNNGARKSAPKQPSANPGVHNPAVNTASATATAPRANVGGQSVSHRPSARSGTKSAPARQSARAKAPEKTRAEIKAEKRARRRAMTAKLYTTASDTKYSFPVAIVLIAVCFTGLILSIVTASVRINDLSNEISDLKYTLSARTSEENELRLLLETRDDLRVVENMAKNEYGMVKTDQVERFYLRTQNADRIELVDEVKEEKGSIFARIPDAIFSLFDRIRASFGW